MKIISGWIIGLVLVVCASAEPLLEGRVRLASGEPVADAQVRLFNLTDLRQGAIARAQTDGTGYFALPLAALRGSALPEGFALGPNYPNPFNPSTIIPYQLAASSEVRLEVFNLLGQRIATLVDGERPAGFHTAAWNATDAAGRAVGAGVYIYRMTVDAASQTGRMVLIDGQAGVSAAGAASDFDWLGTEGGSSEGEPVYGLIVSGEGLAPYVDSAFRVEAGMAPVEVIVSAGSGKAADDDCALCDLFDALHDDDEGPAPSGKALAGLAAPPAPTNLRFEAVTDSSVTVRWDAAAGATDYDVNYKPAVGGRWTNQPHKGIGLYNTITDLEPNTAYRWAVRAENSDGYSEWVFGPNFTTLEEETDETTGSSDDHSNTRSGATVLSLGSSLAGQIETGSDVDYFSVQVGESGTLTVYTTGSLDTKGTLENSSGSRLASNDDGGGGTNFRIESAVSAGTYYIKVESYRSRTGSYIIHANETTEGEDETTEEETETDEATEGAEEDTPEDVPDDAPVTIPDAQLRAAIEDALGKASGVTITEAEMKTLTRLAARDAGISDLTGLELATNLRAMDFGNNHNVSDLSPLSGLTNLRELGLGASNVSDLSPLSGLTNLTKLGLSFINTSDVSSLSGLTNLRELRLYGNDISDVSSLSGLTNLIHLELGNNHNLSDVSSLSGLTNLRELGLRNNNVSDVSSLSGLTNLRELNLRNNNVSDVSSLSGLTNLRELNLWNNDVSDVSSLLGLTNLTHLELGINKVSDVSSLAGLTSLIDLELHFNNIMDVSSLVGLTSLTDLDLRGNPLSDLSINDHIPALENSGVTVFFDFFRVEGDFDIELVFLDHFNEFQKSVIQYSARRWMSVISEDLPDYTLTQGWSGTCGDQPFEIPSGERIDDLRIYVSGVESGPDGTGGPYVLRESHLPIVGCVTFNLKFANWMFVGLHEIGHVLGFGTIWREFGLLQDFSRDDPNADTHFNGPLAIGAFDDVGGRFYIGAKVPVSKWDGAHWRYYPIDNDIMRPDGGERLSAITVQSLADLGYGVDVTQADPYTLAGAASAKASAKVAAAMPSTPNADVTQADVYTLPDVQDRIAGGLPLIFGNDRLRERLESAEWMRGRGFDRRDNRSMGRLVPHPQAELKPLCGAGLRREPIYVIDPQGRIIRTLGD